MGMDPSIETSLERSVENHRNGEELMESANALKRYRQAKSLKILLVNQALVFSLFATGAIVTAAIGLGFFLSSRITRALREISGATRRIAEGDLSYRLKFTSHTPEVNDLKTAFNKMAAQLKKSTDDLRLAEKKATWKEVARTVAHEIKNPLTPIKLSTQRLKRKYESQSPDFAKVLETTSSTILSEIDNMERLVDAFHKYARLPDPNRQRLDLNILARDCVVLHNAGTGIISLKETEPLYVNVDHGQIKEALSNIIKNALEAAGEENAEVKVVVDSRDSGAEDSGAANSSALITVTDNGPGVAAENLDKLFVPYFTTKAQGNGIGLALAERTLSQNGGSLKYAGQQGQGAVFIMEFDRDD